MITLQILLLAYMNNNYFISLKFKFLDNIMASKDSEVRPEVENHIKGNMVVMTGARKAGRFVVENVS